MDTQADVPQHQQSPSIDEIIEWNHELSLSLCEVGYTTQFPTADFFASNLYPDSANCNFDSPDLLENAVQDFTAEYQRSIDRIHYMDANKPLLAKTESEVHSRLLEAGKTEKDIGRYVADKTVLRHKIDTLYELQDSSSNIASNSKPAYLYYGSSSNRRFTKTNLPVHGSLAVFREQIKVYLGCIKDVNESLESVFHDSSPWKYKFKPKMQSVKVGEQWRPLETERDYVNLMRQMMNQASAAFHVVLTQKDWPDRMKAKERQGQRNPLQHYTTKYSASEGVESLFDNVDLCNILEQYGRRQVRSADDAALEELATASRALETRAMNKSRVLNNQTSINRNGARRAQSPQAVVPEYGQQLRRGSGDSSYGQAAFSPRKSDQDAPKSSVGQASPFNSQERRASGGFTTSSPPKEPSNPKNANAASEAQCSGLTGTKRVRLTKEEKGLRGSCTKFFPSKK
ncbi:MAG: hypothetical protein Q9170_002533 [Blastenia crenularia]